MQVVDPYYALLSLCIVLLGLVQPAVARTNVTSTTIAAKYCIVTLNPSYAELGFSKFYHKLKAKGVDYITTAEYRDVILTGVALKLNSTLDLAKLTEVVGIESVHPVHTFPVPKVLASSSTSMSKRANGAGIPWSHKMTGVDKVHAAEKFGQGITIGIVDSGIDYNHPALGGGFGPGHKVVGGYDFVGDLWTGLYDTPPPQPSDNPLDTCDGHGTQLAGIIGANPDPSRGIKGVAYQASINAYRIYGCRGRQQEDIILAGILRAHRDGNDIITLATGYTIEWGKSVLASVLDEIAARGRVVVIAVGNNGRQGSWLGLPSGSHRGIIPVGEVCKSAESPRVQNAYGAIMTPQSVYGPTSDMHLTTAIVAPGEDIYTTIPVRLGRYQYSAGTSVSMAFVAGAVALWLEAKGRTVENAWAARAAFQNTALPVRQNTRYNSMIDTVSHQGAGLIQVDKAIFGTASIDPPEMLLNDTSDADLSWTLMVHNWGQNSVTYTFTHLPAGTAPTMRETEAVLGPVPLVLKPAEVRMSAGQVTVPAGSMRYIRVRFRPPIGLDATTFPVYSGYIKAEGSDGSLLQSLYLGLAASLKQMKILDNRILHMKVPLPVVKGGDGKPIKRPTTYTMRDNDRPVFLFRLASYTPLLRLDLVDGKTTLGSIQRCRPERPERLGVLSKFRQAFGRCPLKSWITRPRRGPERGQSIIIGVIFERRHVERHVQFPMAIDQWQLDRLVISRFADNTAIPNGDYKLLLRALKNYGNPADERDYEVWLSPVIKLRKSWFKEDLAEAKKRVYGVTD